MIETPQVTQAPAREAAVIRLTIPRARIAEVMGPGIGEIFAALGAQGIAPSGPWYSYHRRMDPEIFDFEIGVPVSSPVSPAGRVEPGSLPAAKVARTVYHGPYEGLGDAWGELGKWIEANGHQAGEDLWEYYTTGPESSGDPADWRTELNRPLVG
jgi:effector-binding domain-containing protein